MVTVLASVGPHVRLLKPYGIKEIDSEYQGIGGTASPLGGYNLSVNPNSESIDAALDVIRTAMKDDFLTKWFKLSGFLPPKPKLLKAKSVTSHPLFGQYMDTFSVMADNAIPRPVTPIYFQESKTISQEVHNVVSRSTSPENGMTELKQQLQQIGGTFSNEQ